MKIRWFDSVKSLWLNILVRLFHVFQLIHSCLKGVIIKCLNSLILDIIPLISNTNLPKTHYIPRQYLTWESPLSLLPSTCPYTKNFLWKVFFAVPFIICSKYSIIFLSNTNGNNFDSLMFFRIELKSGFFVSARIFYKLQLTHTMSKSPHHKEVKKKVQFYQFLHTLYMVNMSSTYLDFMLIKCIM